MIDYHVHTEHSGDGSGTVISACEMALNAGLREICFTEHLDYEPSDDCYGKFDYILYKDQIAEARQLFAGRLIIRCGVEVDFQPKYKTQIEDFLDGKELDYVVGSAHYVDGILLENHNCYFPGKIADEAYKPYFDLAMAVVETGLFDTLAHLDLCKRHGVKYFGPFDCKPYDDIIEDILRAVIDKEMALEINTSGIRQTPREPYPCKALLEKYYSLGGRKITIGSDAHKPEDVGAGIIAALNIAHEIGFRYLDTFDGRKRGTREICPAI